MEIKIEKKETFTIAGISMKVEKNSDFSNLWKELIKSKGIDFLCGIGNGQAYGTCFSFNSRDDFCYMAGFDIKDKKSAESKGLEILEIPEADYAIIQLKGKVPDCIHEGWKYVVGTFLPENGLRHTETPDFEVYGQGDMYSDSYTMELWVPVEKE